MVIVQDAAETLVVASRGRVILHNWVMLTALWKNLLLWLAAPLAGSFAVWCVRGERGRYGACAVLFWAAYAPVSVTLLVWLHRAGFIALTA